MFFRTRSGSMYQIDTIRRRVRRISGAKAPTDRQGRDGGWCVYERLEPELPTVGRVVYIFWPRETTPLLEGSPPDAQPATITSVVALIAHSSENPS